MNQDLEKIEREFILDEDIEQEDIISLIRQLSRFCKIDKKGHVMILDRKEKIADKIIIALSARFLANRLQAKLGKDVTIKEDITNADLAKMLREKEAVIAARLKDLKDDGKITSPRRGLNKIMFHAIEKFIKSKEGKKEKE